MYDALSDFKDSNTNAQELWKNCIFRDFAREIMEEAPEVGKEFIEGILTWVKHTRDAPPKEQLKFDSFQDYVEYRSGDYGVE